MIDNVFDKIETSEIIQRAAQNRYKYEYDKIKDNPKLIEHALKSDGMFLFTMPPHLQIKKEFALIALKQSIIVFHALTPELKLDLDIIIYSIRHVANTNRFRKRHGGRNFDYMQSFKDVKDFLTKIFKYECVSDVLKYVPPYILDDKEFLLPLLKNNNIFYYLSDRLKRDSEMQEAYISGNAYSPYLIPNGIIKDFKIACLLIRNDKFMTLDPIHESIIHDKEFTYYLCEIKWIYAWKHVLTYFPVNLHLLKKTIDVPRTRNFNWFNEGKLSAYICKFLNCKEKYLIDNAKYSQAIEYKIISTFTAKLHYLDTQFLFVKID